MQLKELENKYKELNNEELQTVTGGIKDPLYVVDGAIRTIRGLGDLDPEKITSIEVLKDSYSITMRGLESADGVIAIKTRR